MNKMLNIALPKGRLGEKVYAMFEKAGFECPSIRENNRKLIFENAEKGIRYFWVKPSDVAIYVERGAADIGVAGKDILLEYEPDIYELLDLNIGKCRMAVAAKNDFYDDPQRTLRVATKFPNIAGKYYAGLGRQIDIIELEANKAIYNNVAVSVDFPAEDILNSLDYRSKLELTEDVRIVTIEGYDVCACCAPHVKSTGEIGLVKVLSSMRHRGGTRLQILCGLDAFEDYCTKANNLYEIAVKLCAKHNQELSAFNKLCEENNELKQKNVSLANELISVKIKDPQKINGISIYFESSTDMQFVRNLVLESAKLHKGISAVFSGKDENYKYAVASADSSVKTFGDLLRAELSAKGGGSDELIQGNISASKEDLINFLNKVEI